MLYNFFTDSSLGGIVVHVDDQEEDPGDLPSLEFVESQDGHGENLNLLDKEKEALQQDL